MWWSRRRRTLHDRGFTPISNPPPQTRHHQPPPTPDQTHPPPPTPPTTMTTEQKLKASILVISETAHADPSTDKCIPALRNVFLEQAAADKWTVAHTRIVPDDVLLIQRAILEECAEGVNLVVTSGGTGFAVKDVTPEVSFELVSEYEYPIWRVHSWTWGLDS